jgi:hypothetical protein
MGRNEDALGPRGQLLSPGELALTGSLLRLGGGVVVDDLLLGGVAIADDVVVAGEQGLDALARDLGLVVLPAVVAEDGVCPSRRWRESRSRRLRAAAR